MLLMHKLAFAKAYLKLYFDDEFIRTIRLNDEELIEFVEDMLDWEEKSFSTFYK
jgi:hypothetical protein